MYNLDTNFENASVFWEPHNAVNFEFSPVAREGTVMKTFAITLWLGAVILAFIAIIPEFRDWLVKWYWKLFAGIVFVAAMLAIAGCATLSDPAKPRTAAEEFPLRNQDPRVGLVINTGTAPMNLYVYDQANRLIEQAYMSGADRFITGPNGEVYPQYWKRLLEPGCYRVESFPFYHAVRIAAMAMVRVDLQKQIYSVCVGNNPTAYYYGGNHWGWVLYVGANIPDGATGLPAFQINMPFN